MYQKRIICGVERHKEKLRAWREMWKFHSNNKKNQTSMSYTHTARNMSSSRKMSFYVICLCLKALCYMMQAKLYQRQNSFVILLYFSSNTNKTHTYVKASPSNIIPYIYKIVQIIHHFWELNEPFFVILAKQEYDKLCMFFSGLDKSCVHYPYNMTMMSVMTMLIIRTSELITGLRYITGGRRCNVSSVTHQRMI